MIVEKVSHRVSLMGEVLEKPVTGNTNAAKKPIDGALVRVIDGPFEGFTERLIVRARLIPQQDRVTDRLCAFLDDTSFSNAEKLQTAQILLDYVGLIYKAKRKALYGILNKKLYERLTDSTQDVAGILRGARTVFDTYLAGARVAVAHRPDCAWTTASGHFHFLDLPAGGYQLAASLPGSGTRFSFVESAAIAVPLEDGNGNSPAFAELELPSTGLRGRITKETINPETGETTFVPASLVTVRAKGRKEQAFSAMEGSNGGTFILNGLEAGPCTIETTLRDYANEERSVTLIQGEVYAFTEDIRINKKGSNHYSHL